ncbi:MAG: AmmeMemoRadiSam system protein B [Oscillospiraceae bacterium]|nr:AmmeMemoRadiSam system protein B [Oscillospiraceae bacterium]
MTQRLKITAAVCTAALLLAGCRAVKNEESVSVSKLHTETVYTETESTPEEKTGQRLLPSSFYKEKSFRQHVSGAESYDFQGEMHCATVPHHLTAGRLIASLLKTASESREKTDTVVVCATMHFGKTDFMTTSYSDWDTPFGALECDRQLTKKLSDGIGAVSDDEAAALDHGIAALIPYIKYYFPDSEIVYTLIDNRADDGVPEKLTSLLKEMNGEKDCFFLFSADFSHYLVPEQTELHDRETLKAVLEKDLGKIAKMTDSNVDSPFVLGTFTRLSCELGESPVFLDRSNSLIMSGIPYNSVTYGEGLTSYFIFAA